MINPKLIQKLEQQNEKYVLSAAYHKDKIRKIRQKLWANSLKLESEKQKQQSISS
jgi:hypothetical protein